MVRIKSKRQGFRRCGIAHPSSWVEYPDSRWSRSELARLQADPMLIVEIVEDSQDSCVGQIQDTINDSPAFDIPGSTEIDETASIGVHQTDIAIADPGPLETPEKPKRSRRR